MGSDAFRSLFRLYQSKTRMSEQVEMLEQLKRQLSGSADDTASSSTAAANPSLGFQVFRLFAVIHSGLRL